MKAAFLFSASVAPDALRTDSDATAWHSSLPRAIRKTLRVPSHKAKPDVAHTDLTETFRRDRPTYAEQLAVNTVDYDMDDNEHNDDFGLDDPTTHYSDAGLTIVAMGRDTRRWLKGYNIL